MNEENVPYISRDSDGNVKVMMNGKVLTDPDLLESARILLECTEEMLDKE